ncbi:hypothetical protein [Meiothermus sp.]|uniref:hypothetical protein n=1 Tax=Meiothermus sp. TaxID=1955249 RepID=UPI0021DE0716|nr:hypothetical protein [Meiothermus sp.]GIW33309.1 MAG: hypothetical protein KatS3mg072_0642 [Meiothermus sp.]
MKRLALLGSVLALAFAGCGLISSPPIDNPFQLGGKSITFNLVSASATGSANVTATFEDLTNLNLPANPSGFTYNLAIQSVSFGAGCPATIPSPINVTLNATLTVSDGSGATARSSTASASNVQFTLTNSGSQITVGNLTGGTLNLNVGQILPIIQNGGTNTAVLAAQITTVSTPDLAGCAMTITWGGGQGTLKF